MTSHLLDSNQTEIRLTAEDAEDEDVIGQCPSDGMLISTHQSRLSLRIRQGEILRRREYRIVHRFDLVRFHFGGKGIDDLCRLEVTRKCECKRDGRPAQGLDSVRDEGRVGS